MISMFISVLGKDKNVIYKHHYKLASRDFVYKIHEGCGSIGEAKWHHHKLIVTMPISKRSLGDVFRFNTKLIVS